MTTRLDARTRRDVMRFQGTQRGTLKKNDPLVDLVRKLTQPKPSQEFATMLVNTYLFGEGAKGDPAWSSLQDFKEALEGAGVARPTQWVTTLYNVISGYLRDMARNRRMSASQRRLSRDAEAAYYDGMADGEFDSYSSDWKPRAEDRDLDEARKPKAKFFTRYLEALDDNGGKMADREMPEAMRNAVGHADVALIKDALVKKGLIRGGNTSMAALTRLGKMHLAGGPPVDESARDLSDRLGDFL